MFSRSFLFVCTTAFLVAAQVRGDEAPKGGWLRERIKQRWIQKQATQPAPAARTDVAARIEKPGDYIFTYGFEGRARYYKIHVPSSYQSKTSAALLVVLHGGGGDMNIPSDDQFYKQISKSESEGFIAVFPNGVSKFVSGKLATWNAGACCGAARDEKIDDVGFIKDVVAKVSKQLSIDPKRVYATGMSNGGMMAYRLACEAPEVFRAIASVAGTDNTATCAPKTPVAILHIHAKDDDHVLFGGGARKGAFNDRTQVADFTSVASTVSKWVKLDGCTAPAKRALEKPGAFCERYEKCSAGGSVQLCVTETGGHSWPGGRKVRSVGEAPSTAISANDVMWDFFKSLH